MALKKTSLEKARQNMQLVYKGKIRNHKLKNVSEVHSGEIEEKEVNAFYDFLNTRNCLLIMDLEGKYK